ncbi:MAG: hypothetical protein IJA27_07870 [Lachnospiraceae bacterium]|nr:hypothetical protein [Lachnospiraceae bacterium]
MSLNYIYHVDCLKGRYLEIFSQVELYAEVHGIGEDAMNDGLMNFLFCDILLRKIQQIRH